MHSGSILKRFNRIYGFRAKTEWLDKYYVSFPLRRMLTKRFVGWTYIRQ